jgi:peptide/nickel transport system substrate-binding protein
MFGEWVQGDHYSIKRNPNYWMAGRPYLDGMETLIISDPQALVVQFEGGAFDVIDSPMIRDITRYQGDAKYVVVLDPPNQTLGFEFNTTYPPMDNQQFREALNYAIDRNRMADVLLGLGSPLDLPWPSGSPAYDEAQSNQYRFDLDRARSMLADSGVDLSAAQLEIVVQPSEPDLGTMAQIYQADLAQLGLDVKITSYATAAFQDQLNNRKYMGIATYRSNNVNMQPAGLLLRNGGWKIKDNQEGYSSPEYTQMVQALAVETDPEGYQQLASKLNTFLLDLSAMVPVTTIRTAMVSTPQVHDLRRGVGTQLLITDTWLG